MNLSSHQSAQEAEGLAAAVGRLAAAMPRKDAGDEPQTALARDADFHLARVTILMDSVRNLPEPSPLGDRLLLLEVGAAAAVIRQLVITLRNEVRQAQAVLDGRPAVEV